MSGEVAKMAAVNGLAALSTQRNQVLLAIFPIVARTLYYESEVDFLRPP